MMRNRDAMRRVGQWIVMRGALGPGNITEHAEFNLFADPQAARIVLTADTPKVIIPSETCDLLPASEDFVRRTRAARTGVATVRDFGRA